MSDTLASPARIMGTRDTYTTDTTYECPNCRSTVTVFPDAVSVGHRCPMKRRQWVSWVVVR